MGSQLKSIPNGVVPFNGNGFVQVKAITIISTTEIDPPFVMFFVVFFFTIHILHLLYRSLPAGCVAGVAGLLCVGGLRD